MSNKVRELSTGLPAFSGTLASPSGWTPDGKWGVVGGSVTPFWWIIENNFDGTFTRHNKTLEMELENANQALFSPDGSMLVLVSAVSPPHVEVFSHEDGVFTKIPNPPGLAEVAHYRAAFSPQGDRLVLTFGEDPRIVEYSISGTTFTKTEANPFPGLSGINMPLIHIARDADVIAGTVGDQLRVARYSDGDYVQVGSATLAATGNGATLSPDGEFCLVSLVTSSVPGIVLYRVNPSSLSLVGNPIDTSNQSSFGSAFHPSGEYMVSLQRTPISTSRVRRRSENGENYNAESLALPSAPDSFTNPTYPSFIGDSFKFLVGFNTTPFFAIYEIYGDMTAGGVFPLFTSEISAGEPVDIEGESALPTFESEASLALTINLGSESIFPELSSEAEFALGSSEPEWWPEVAINPLRIGIWSPSFRSSNEVLPYIPIYGDHAFPEMVGSSLIANGLVVLGEGNFPEFTSEAVFEFGFEVEIASEFPEFLSDSRINQTSQFESDATFGLFSSEAVLYQQIDIEKEAQFPNVISEVTLNVPTGLIVSGAFPLFTSEVSAKRPEILSIDGRFPIFKSEATIFRTIETEIEAFFPIFQSESTMESPVGFKSVGKFPELTSYAEIHQDVIADIESFFPEITSDTEIDVQEGTFVVSEGRFEGFEASLELRFPEGIRVGGELPFFSSESVIWQDINVNKVGLFAEFTSMLDISVPIGVLSAGKFPIFSSEVAIDKPEGIESNTRFVPFTSQASIRMIAMLQSEGVFPRFVSSLSVNSGSAGDEVEGIILSGGGPSNGLSISPHIEFGFGKGFGIG